MSEEHIFTIPQKVRAVFQDEEIEDAREEATREGIDIMHVLFRRAADKLFEALKIGAAQYEGALVTVEAIDGPGLSRYDRTHRSV